MDCFTSSLKDAVRLLINFDRVELSELQGIEVKQGGKSPETQPWDSTTMRPPVVDYSWQRREGFLNWISVAFMADRQAASPMYSQLVQDDWVAYSSLLCSYGFYSVCMGCPLCQNSVLN